MELKSGGRILRAAGAPRQTFVAKSTKWCSYLLWGIVFVRLCCPILPETGISLIPDKLLSVGTEMTSGQQTVGPGSHGYAEANDTKDIGDVLRREYDAEEVPDSQAAEKTMAGGNDNTVMNTDGTQDFPWELREQKVELRLQGWQPVEQMQ